MNSLKRNTETALAIAMIMLMLILAGVAVESMLSYSGNCLNGQACSRLNYLMQRLSISLALGWKLIVLVAIFPLLVHSASQLAQKIFRSKNHEEKNPEEKKPNDPGQTLN